HGSASPTPSEAWPPTTGSPCSKLRDDTQPQRRLIQSATCPKRHGNFNRSRSRTPPPRTLARSRARPLCSATLDQSERVTPPPRTLARSRARPLCLATLDQSERVTPPPRTSTTPPTARSVLQPFDTMIERIPASRCSRCGLIVAPPATYCPHHPARMTPTTVPGVGEIVSYTTLHSAPEGFRSPLHIALVQLQGGARFVCHGAQTPRVR